jgi:hypothetical protein
MPFSPLPHFRPQWKLALALAAAFILAQPSGAQAQGRKYEFKADLDPVILLPAAYSVTPDQLEKLFTEKDMKKNPYFTWLTERRSRALFQRKPFSNVTVDLTMFGGKVPINEAIIDFKDGKFVGITVSIFNRGDGGKISADDFKERLATTGRVVGEQLDIRPKRKKANPAQGMLTEGWMWISARGMAVLEHNPEAPNDVEFLRLRLARRDAKGAYAAAMKSRTGASVSLSDLPKFVERDAEGNVYVKDLPMVDQGQKGYCVVASTQRLFEYYGIACDQHQLAQIANADPERGTSILSIIEELGAIDHRFKTRFEALAIAGNNGRGLYELKEERYIGDEIEEREFQRLIRKNIDSGLPLLWSLQLGRYEEEPSTAQQSGGGHMRMIIGYNDKTERIIFSDSWGAGHEFKTMDAHDVYLATDGLFLLKPTTH